MRRVWNAETAIHSHLKEIISIGNISLKQVWSIENRVSSNLEKVENRLLTPNNDVKRAFQPKNRVMPSISHSPTGVFYRGPKGICPINIHLIHSESTTWSSTFTLHHSYTSKSVRLWSCKFEWSGFPRRASPRSRSLPYYSKNSNYVQQSSARL